MFRLLVRIVSVGLQCYRQVESRLEPSLLEEDYFRLVGVRSDLSQRNITLLRSHKHKLFDPTLNASFLACRMNGREPPTRLSAEKGSTATCSDVKSLFSNVALAVANSDTWGN
jgi:hypothetical protein